jgi:hypothetical protein
VTRYAPTQLVQGLDADGVVIMDDSTGAEITVPAEYLDRLITALSYFRDAFTEQLMPYPDPPVPASAAVPVHPDTKAGRRLGKGRWSR